MAASNIKKRHAGILVAGLIVCANIIRIIAQRAVLFIPLCLVYTVIFIGLCIGWGVSVNRRIVQRTVRRYMIGVSALAVFWLVTRSIKYYFTNDPVLARYLWYSYYVPMLFIPLFSVLVALSLGKPETYRPSQWLWLLMIPAALSVIVLTNDLHQLVFTFPEGAVWSDDDYGYGIIYSLIWASEVAGALAAIVIMLGKCRLARRKKYLPTVLILLAIGYSGLYALFSGQEIFDILAGDMVMVYSLLNIGILESAIQCGLIQTNTGYAELFAAGTVGAQIADSDYRIHYTSANARELTEKAMRDARSGAVSLDKNTLLKGQPIAGGYVFWQEDITALTAMLEKMESNRATIAQNNHIEEESLRVKRKIHALREKKRLYDLLQAKIAPQINLLNRLFSQYNQETDAEKRRRLLGQIAVVGAYIKRSGNLLFIGEKSDTTDTAELALCMEESFANLSLMGVECAMDIPSSHRIATQDAIGVYDVFEGITEAAIDTLHSVWLKARSLDDAIIFRLDVECETSLAAFAQLAERCEEEDGIWSFSLRIGKAGDAA